MDTPRTGVLLVNLGTPDAPETGAVRRYLREFLSDPRVIDIPTPARLALVHAVIAPFRARRSARQYKTVWGPDGSPLLVHSRALADALAARLGDAYAVALAMRYRSPSIDAALGALVRAGVSRIRVLPLFPQYASSSTGSALERVFAMAGAMWNVPPLEVIAPFYAEPGFIRAVAEVARPVLASARPDHVLMSYHGLPERQIAKSDTSGSHCLRAGCCDAIGTANQHCYRAQSYATSRALAGALELEPAEYSVSFQSRLGRNPWIQPFTDEVVKTLIQDGVRRLAVVCPSFVADCLETVEEIDVRLRDQWLGLGGDTLTLVPCVNAHPAWVDAVAELVR